MRYLFLAVAVLLQPVLAESQEAESQEAESQEKIHVRYNLNSSAGYTHIGKEGIDDTANRDKYVNFSASAFVEFPNKVFLSGLCATEGVPGELAWNTPSTWKRAYCDLAAGYLAFEIPEQNLTIGAFAFVGQQFKITTLKAGLAPNHTPRDSAAVLVLYFGEKSWLYAAVFKDETLRAEGAGFGALFQTDLWQVGSKAHLASRTRLTVGDETTVLQEIVFAFGG